MLDENDDNFYARFDTHSLSLLQRNDLFQEDLCQSHWSMKSRSRSTGHSACSKSMQRTITMQGLMLTAIMAVEKHTLM